MNAPARPYRMWVVVLALIVLTGIGAAGRLLRDEPEAFADPAMQFKYGSTGGDRNFGIPYAIWKVLPARFDKHLPEGRKGEGWAAFGFISEMRPEEAKEWPRLERPVGTTMRNYMGIDRVFLNCAVCHAGTVRKTDKEAPLVVAGMPANTIDLEAFQNFLIAVGNDKDFNADEILKAIDEDGVELDFINRIALRLIGVDQMRDLIQRIGKRFEFVQYEPEFGPGRFDTFSPAKALLNWPAGKIPPYERIGVVDFPSVWHQEAKRRMQLHWDGNNDKLEERNRSAAFGTGANFPLLDRQSVKRFEDWLLTAKPPSFAETMGVAIDPAKAEQGRQIYGRECASCHGASGTDFTGPYVGKVTPIAAIGTDRHRLDNYTRELMINQNTFYAGDANERFQHFRKTDGYANAPLDGLWLRAPYLHNGSVPSLRDLLKKPEERPRMFIRGHDVYDTRDMGFVSRPEAIPPEARQRLFCFAIDKAGEAACGAPAPKNNGMCEGGTCLGNGNEGHDYATGLAEVEKDALLEYLKTF